jgi:hypothetical protein
MTNISQKLPRNLLRVKKKKDLSECHVCLYIHIYIYIYIYTHIHRKGTPKVMPHILLCWPMMLEADAGGMAVEAEPSRRQ